MTLRSRWFWFYDNGRILPGRVISNRVGDGFVTLLAIVNGRTRVFFRRRLWLYSSLAAAERELSRA